MSEHPTSFAGLFPKQEKQLSCDKRGEPIAWSTRNKDVTEVCEKIDKHGLTMAENIDAGPYLVWMLKSLNQIVNTPQPHKPLTDEQIEEKFKSRWGLESWRVVGAFYKVGHRDSESAHNIKE